MDLSYAIFMGKVLNIRDSLCKYENGQWGQLKMVTICFMTGCNLQVIKLCSSMKQAAAI